MRVLHAHTRVFVQLTSECAAGKCEGVPYFSVVTQLPSLRFLSVVFLWWFHSLLVDAELLRFENIATNGKFAMGKGHSYYVTLETYILMEMKGPRPTLSRMPRYWEMVGEGQPSQSRD